MTRVGNVSLERLGDDVLDLMVRRSCLGIGEAEAIELAEACRREGMPVDALDGAVDAVLSLDAIEAMPDGLRERLAASAAAIGGAAEGTLSGASLALAGSVGGRPEGFGSPRSGIAGRLGWVAAAAGLTLAAVAWFGDRDVTSGDGPSSIGDPLAAIDSAADVVRLNWGDWDNPEVAGVRGEVVWSDAAQAGYMRFAGLPEAGKDAQYQLWIIDAERGMEQRISGGVFDARASSSGEVVVPITPRLFVNKAAAFAVTIERPGGTWVSDMSRRVVIASRG